MISRNPAPTPERAAGGSPPAAAQRGRSLRIELAQHDVSVSVAYWGVINTPLARDALAGSLGERFLATFPGWLVSTIGPELPAAAIVRGVERRAPRILASRRWALMLLNGLINPLIDRRFERHAQHQAVVREADRIEPAVHEPAESLR